MRNSCWTHGSSPVQVRRFILKDPANGLNSIQGFRSLFYRVPKRNSDLRERILTHQDDFSRRTVTETGFRHKTKLPRYFTTLMRVSQAPLLFFSVLVIPKDGSGIISSSSVLDSEWICSLNQGSITINHQFHPETEMRVVRRESENMGTRTSLVGRMAVLLIVLSTFVLAESAVGKTCARAVNSVTRTAVNSVTRTGWSVGVPVMH